MPNSGAATFWMNAQPPVEPFRARSIPMLLAALAFAAGILCARQWHPTFSLVGSLALSFAGACYALRSRPVVAWSAVLCFLMVVGCWCAQVQTPIARPGALRMFADGLSRTVEGRIVAVHNLPARQRIQGSPTSPVEPWLTEPEAWESEQGEATQGVDVFLDAIEEVTPDVSTMRPVQGGLRLTLTGDARAIRCGDLIRLPVRLRSPEIYRNPGAFSYADWLGQQGVDLLGTAPSTSVQRVAMSAPSLFCRMNVLQLWSARRLEALSSAATSRHMPGYLRLAAEDTALLAAMLFGDRTHLTEAQKAGFERTGTFHLLVISGFHIALVTTVLFNVLRRCRVPEFYAVALTILLGTAFALLTGFGVPAQRALAMTCLYLLAAAMDRKRSGLNALGVAALAMLAASPRTLYESSFQMTALVILAVSGMAVPLERRLLGTWQSTVRRLEVLELDMFLEPKVAARRVALRMWGALLRNSLEVPLVEAFPAMMVKAMLIVAQAVLLSFTVELCMALPMAVYFHRLAPLALPANLLVSPIAGALAVVAAVMFLLSLISPWLALLPGAITAVLLHLTTSMVHSLGQSGVADLRSPAPRSGAVLLCIMLLAVVVWALPAQRRSLVWAGALSALAIPVVALWPVRPDVQAQALEVTALDVGQGDSILVVSPEGRTMLLDAGGPVGRVASRWDVGEQVVAPYLWSRHLRRLDVVVITHGHSDHIGGMPAILRDLRPRELWLSLEPGQSMAMREILHTAQLMGTHIRWMAAGDELRWGSVKTTVLSPERTYANFGEAKNDDSLVLRLDWARASVLLEGDAELPSEAAMLAHERVHPVTLLKVGHHGSRTSTSPDFLAAADPQAAVISVGQQNTFGHPRWEVLERLESSHVRTFRTDRAGASTFLLHADGTMLEPGAYN